RQFAQVPLPVVVASGSAAGPSNPAPASATSPGGGAADNSQSAAANLPGTAPVVIGSKTPLGSAPPLMAISASWGPLVAVLALLPLVLLALGLTSRRRRRTDAAPPPDAGPS